MQTREQRQATLQQAWQWTLENGSFWFGLPQETLQWTLILGGGYLLFLLIVTPLHRWSKKKKSDLEKTIVMQIDEMIYLLAKHQYLSHIDMRSLGGNPHLALMTAIFTEGNCDYIQSGERILASMHKVESLLGKQVIASEVESDFLQKLRRFRLLKIVERILKILLAIATLGIYALIG